MGDRRIPLALTFFLGCAFDAAVVRSAPQAPEDDGATVLASDESPVRGLPSGASSRRTAPKSQPPVGAGSTPAKAKVAQRPNVPASPATSGVPGAGQAKTATPSRATIESSSLKGIEPGASTVADLKREWGEPKETSPTDDGTRFVYELPGFKRIEVFTANDKVGYMLLQFARSFPAEEVAKQLKFEGVDPVAIHDEQGKPLGLAYPERGVVLSYDDAAKSNQVSQILLEGVTVESFVLRAEARWRGKPSASLADCDYALEKSPQNHRAWWLKAQILTAASRYVEADAAAKEALKLAPTNHAYRLTHALILSRTGEYETALQITQEVIAAADVAAQDKARALCQLGDLASIGPTHDYKQAIEFYTKAIETADAIAKHRTATIRREAKYVLVDAHLGASMCVAWGNWNKKENVVPKWLGRANEVIDDLVQRDDGDPELKFQLARRTLAAQVGMRGKVDATGQIRQIAAQGNQLLANSADPLYRSRIAWQLALAHFDALQAAHARNQAAQAIQYGKQALVLVDQAAAGRGKTLEEEYFTGQLMFRIGAVYAVLQEKHAEAITWYAKAVPILERPAPPSDLVDPLQQGEAFISMGVSYWATGAKQKAVELTSEGVHLFEQAVESGMTEQAHLEVPYSNLATMHSEMGNQEKSKQYAEMAAKLKQQTRQQ
jgi:tetratricopeptide (TPR) repeat protein